MKWECPYKFSKGWLSPVCNGPVTKMIRNYYKLLPMGLCTAHAGWALKTGGFKARPEIEVVDQRTRTVEPKQ